MLKIALCDDDPGALAHVQDLLEQFGRETHIQLRADPFQSALAMLDALRKTTYEVVLLDILMPGLTGLQAARELRAFDSRTKIIFLTSSPEFAVESYQVEAFSYLLKPIRRKDLFPLLEKAARMHAREQESLLLTMPAGLVRVACRDIELLEVNSKRLLFYLEDGTVRQISGTLAEYEPQLLRQGYFLKVHRSYIVNMDCIRTLCAGELTTYSGRKAPISRLLSAEVRKAYMAFLFRKEGEGIR